MPSLALRIAACSALLALQAVAQTLPAGFTASTVTSGLSWPTRMAFAPDGRIFILEQGGRIRVVKGGQLLAAPFATVTTVTSIISNSEEGLLGIAVDPDFAANGHLYVYYTALNPEHQRISRFKAAGDVAEAGSETPLIDFARGSCHCGGALDFGPDGKLYVGTGDGYNSENPQSLTTLKGKVLRMNPVPDSAAQVPTDNPFYAQAAGSNRLIYALGLRNPWSMAFQPGTGRLFVNDVGWHDYEEINEAKPGRNFGWPQTEGPFDQALHPQYTNPVFAYRRDGAGPTLGSLIVGGAFYNPPTALFPAEYVGKYFFSDYAYNGWIRHLDPANPSTATAFIPRPVGAGFLDVKVGPDGALYYLVRATNGSLVRVTYGGSPIQRGHSTGSLGLTAGSRALAYSIPAGGHVRLRVFDGEGRLMASLVDGSMPAGNHTAAWETAASSSGAAPGVYHAVLESHGQRLARPLVLLR